MPRNQSFDKPTKERKDFYHNINNGVVRENTSKDLKRTIKKGFIYKLFRFMFKSFLIFLILGLSLAAGGAFAIWSLSQKLPDISKIEAYTPSETSEIYDVNGKVLAKLHDEENRIIVPLKDIPKDVQNAVLSMEDERFYTHFGVDPKGVMRAVGSFFNKSLVKGGASTITQQLARNLFLTPEVKITRKVAEWILAIKMEQKFSKSKILELYLNQVYWGHNSYGVEAASRTFFGKSVKQLNLAEASLLGGLLSSPEYYSPHRNFEMAKWRQSLTLANMVKLKYITKADANKAKNTPIKLFNVKRSYKLIHPYFTSYVISVLTEKYGDNLLRKGGLKIYTTMDPVAQTLAEKIISTKIPRLKITNNIGQGAIVSLDPNTGFIKTLVGGTSYEQSQFNRATQAKRQPGSSFKPFVYLTAFGAGVITPDTVDVDAPISYPDMSGVWSPKNYDGGYRGAMTIRDAVKRSVNTIAVKTLDRVGVDKVIETAKILGIESYIGPNLSVALGSAEVTPLELASAYGAFATGGKRPPQITPILKIEDRNGNIIEDNRNQELEQVFQHRAIDMLVSCLRAVVDSGTGTAAALPGRPVGGKTGTTSDHKDSWFVGIIPQRVTLVWIGNDNNSKMWKATGGVFCAPIWKEYMTEVVKTLPIKDFPKAGANDKKIVKAKNLKSLTGAYNLNNSNSAKTDFIEETNQDENDTKIIDTEKTNGNNITNTNDQKENNTVIDTNQEKNPYIEQKTPLNRSVEVTELKQLDKVQKPIERKIIITPTEKPIPIQTPIQILVPKREPKKSPKVDEELNNAMEDLKSVKELYNTR
jgi:penicillin-binding protein 1A